MGADTRSNVRTDARSGLDTRSMQAKREVKRKSGRKIRDQRPGSESGGFPGEQNRKGLGLREQMGDDAGVGQG
jgi:hypothetical protein